MFYKYFVFYKPKAAEGTNSSWAHTHVEGLWVLSVDSGPRFGARDQTSEDLNKTTAIVLSMVLTNTTVPTISDGLRGPGSKGGVPDWELHRPASGIQAGVRRSKAQALTPRSWRKGEWVSGSEGSGNPRKMLDKPHPRCRAPAQHASSTGTFPCL